MPNTPISLYLDWQLWSAIIAVAALVLSQLPPVHLWFRPRRLEVEVHSRLQLSHKVGNPNVGMYLSIRNTGGRDLRIKTTQLSLIRDGIPVRTLPALTYFEAPTSQSSIIFVPFSLKPDEAWAHVTNFVLLFDRATEKNYKESEKALSFDIKSKILVRAIDDKLAVIAEPHLVKPFFDIFERLFIWEEGEYIIELKVDVEPGSASFTKKYRFTLHESDSRELRSHKDDYPFGAGLSFNAERDTEILVRLVEHAG